jgi:hypothetical protein
VRPGEGPEDQVEEDKGRSKRDKQRNGKQQVHATILLRVVGKSKGLEGERQLISARSHRFEALARRAGAPPTGSVDCQASPRRVG